MPPREKSEKNVPALYNNKNAQKWSYAAAETLFEELINWFLGSEDDSLQDIHEKLKNVFISVFLANKRLHKGTLDYLIEKYDKKPKRGRKLGPLAEMKAIAMTIQEARIKDYGFKDVGNAKFAEFLLKNNHEGYNKDNKALNEHSEEDAPSEREQFGDESLKALGFALIKAKETDSR